MPDKAKGELGSGQRRCSFIARESRRFGRDDRGNLNSIEDKVD